MNSFFSFFKNKTFKPFCDYSCDGFFYRYFKEDTKESDLVWHKDEENRKVKVFCGRKWKIQFDNELPKELHVNEEFEIPKYKYHRLIKGEGDLLLKIEEE